MDFGIAGKSAFVAGGTRGIGLAIARELAREGARLFVASRNRANVDSAIAAIRAEHGTVEGCAADCTDPAQLSAALAAADTAHGPSLIAVMVPKGSLGGSFAAADDALFEAGNRQLILPLLHMARSVLPAMRGARWGQIISIASMSVRMAHRNVAMCVADTYRLGSVGLVKTMPDDLGPFGITVNSVARIDHDGERSRHLHAHGGGGWHRVRHADRLPERGHPPEASGSAGGDSRGLRLPLLRTGKLCDRADMAGRWGPHGSADLNSAALAT